ncbi:hypothetical protein [Kribbella sp. CA-247076]|uniref:hypothetical protein n=1 Tax=Kribbella sp. CA-247076 TaxID=3239941 RepID=UPI003D902572
MTDLLKRTLTEQAQSAEPPALDLDGIVAAGDRRISRRRFTAVLGGGVLGAAAIAGGVSVGRSIDRRPVPTPFTERRPTYAVGSEIHYGQEVVSVAPHQVTAFVQTDAGFVFLDRENNIRVADGTGVRSLGKNTWSLTADDRGTLVGWVEGFDNHGESVVYDVAAGREVVRTAIGNEYGPGSLAVGPRIVAIDGDYAYFGTLDGLYRWNVAADKGELIADVAPDAVRTVTAGQMVYQVPDGPPRSASLTIGTTPTEARPVRFSGHQAFLSPAAKYVVTAPDDVRLGIQPSWADLQIFDVAGRNVRTPEAYQTLVFGQWLDEETFTAAGERRAEPSGPADLLKCSVRTGACEVVAHGFSTFTFSQTPPRITPFALPTGSPVRDLY